jgi:hypothetical protein
VSDTLEATAAVPESPSPETPSQSPRRHHAPALIRAHPWWIVGAGLVLFSTGLVYWAGTSPGYDPYGWLIWGYQTLHLTLDLGGAPSWKPLTWLFTVPYSLFGHAALRLWMITAVAVTLSGCIFAGRIAYRLTRGGSARAWPAIAAAVFAGLGVLGIQDYFHYTLSVQSDPMIVSMCLGAIDCHLSRHPRWAFALGVLASLGRPEVWPFLGLYTIWAWRAVPQMRWMLCAGIALIPLLWFGVPTITNNRPFVSGQLAMGSPRELKQSKFLGVIHRFTALSDLPLQLLALVAVGLAWWRRNWTVLILAGGVVGWVAVEVAFSYHGWPAVPRYLFESAGLMIVLAAIAVGWLLQGVPELGPRVPRWAGTVVVGIAVVALIPAALTRARVERRDLTHERARTTEINRLAATINHLGGPARFQQCGGLVVTVRYVSALAYFMNLNDGVVGRQPEREMRHSYPIVVFEPLNSGWKVIPWHTAPSMAQRCAGLNASWIATASHPHGVLVRN